MLEAFSTPRNRTRSVVFLGTCVVLAAAAAVVGIDDNLPGVLLAFGAASALILAFVHPWRTAKRFLGFLLASLLGFVVCGVLHNVFHGLAGQVADVAALRIPLQVLSVTTFLLAVLIGPPAILVGAVGSIVMFIRTRRRPGLELKMTRITILTLIAGCCVMAQSALAQPYYARGSYYAGTGATWDYDTGNQLFDDGAHGDGLAGDGIYAATIVSDQPAGLHEFKIANADWSELWPHNPSYPTENARLITTAPGEAIYFRLDTNPRPGWTPESGAVMTDHALPSGTGLELMGSAPELGSWTTPVAAAEQDGIWTAEVTLVAVGAIEYKFRSIGSWDWSFGAHYNMLIGDNFAFDNTTGNETVVFTFDANDGRSAVEGATPAERTTWGRLKRLGM